MSDARRLTICAAFDVIKLIMSPCQIRRCKNAEQMTHKCPEFHPVEITILWPSVQGAVAERIFLDEYEPTEPTKHRSVYLMARTPNSRADHR